MLNKIIILLTLFVSSSAFAEFEHSVECDVINGVAVARVTNLGEQFDYEGVVEFTYYDNWDYPVGSDSLAKNGTLSRNQVKEFKFDNIPLGADFCQFDFSDTLPVNENPYEDAEDCLKPDVQTMCILDRGVAKGFVKNKSDRAVRISGEVSFIFYDKNFNNVEVTDAFTVYTLRRGEKQNIESVRAPKDASACTLNVNKANH